LRHEIEHNLSYNKVEQAPGIEQPLAQTLSGHPQAWLPLPRPGSARHNLRARLHASQENQCLNRSRWSETRHQEVDDGIWLVSFLTYDLGYVDLEQKTLQTLDNPFGTRL